MEHSSTVGMNLKWKTIWQFLNCGGSTIPLLGISKRNENMFTQKLYMSIQRALFILPQMCKQPKCLSADEWIDKK